MFKTCQEVFVNMKNKLLIYRNREANDNSLNLKKLSALQEQQVPRRPCNEERFLLCTFYFSLSIVCCKLLFANKECFRGIYAYGRKLVTISLKGSDDIVSKLSFLLVSLWNIVAKFNWLLMPALAGLGITVFTWRIVYLDSCVPGVNPPCPFSTPNFKWQRIHPSYMFAIAAGVIVFFITFFNLNWNSIFL